MITSIELFKRLNESYEGVAESVIARFSNVSTVEDVRAFFKALMDELSLSFHPDDSFDGYGNQVNGQWVDLFTPEEATQLDAIMHQCWKVCYDNNTDIYKIGLILMGYEPEDEDDWMKDTAIDPGDIPIYKRVLGIQ